MKDNIIPTNEELVQMMLRGVGKVRSQEEIEDDLDREFQERMKKQAEQEEAERCFRERLEQERKERQEMNYMVHKEIFDFMKVFNELDEEDYYAIVETNDGKQYFAKPSELKRDADYMMFYIERKVIQNSIFDKPFETILETNINEIKGLKLENELKKEIIITKTSRFGKFEE